MDMNITDYAENSALQLTENYKFSNNTLKVVLLNVRSITKNDLEIRYDRRLCSDNV